MIDLKKTLKDSVGLPWRLVGFLGILLTITSVPMAIWGSSLWAYLMIGLGSSLFFMEAGRSYTIASLYRISTITGLRDRLILYNDAEYLLNDVKRDCIWRGEEVPAYIDENLQNLTAQKQAFQQRIMDLFSDVMKPEVKDKVQN